MQQSTEGQGEGIDRRGDSLAMALSPDARARLLAARQLQTSVALALDAFAAYRRLLKVPGLSYDERRGSWLAASYADVERILPTRRRSRHSGR